MSDEWQAYLKDTRIICKYGVKCYQKNPEHQKKFKHPPQTVKEKAVANKRNKIRFNPYSRNEKTKNADKTPDEDKTINVDRTSDEDGTTICDKTPDIEETGHIATEVPNAIASTTQDSVPEKDFETFTKITLNDNTQYLDTASEYIFKECFLVDMPQDFFKFYECLKSVEGSFHKLLATVNLQLIGPYDLLCGKLPIIDNKDLYLIHWRFFYDPPEFQSVLKKTGNSEFHIGYFRDSPNEAPVFLAANDSKKDYVIKPVAKNIFEAVYWYLQQEKKTSPFVSIACQKLLEKISIWAKEHNYSLEEFSMKSRQVKTVCKSFHGAGIVVPYDKKTQLGYRPLVETDAKIKKLFKQLEDAKSQDERDKTLSEIQPIITFANIAVDECDFGTGLEAGIAMFCSGRKELEHTVINSLCSVYSLLNRDAFSKIIQVHMKHRRKGPDMSIISQ